MLDLLKVIGTELPQHLVIFDMPPLTSDDVLTFAPRVDGVLLVVAEGRTERASLSQGERADRGDEHRGSGAELLLGAR